MKRRIQFTLTVVALTLSLILAAFSMFAGIRAAVAAKRAAAFATITVNSAADGTLAALAGNGTCDLREAIEAANTNAVVGQCEAGMAGTDTISFAPNVTGTITLTAGELALNEDVTIQGPGARLLTVSGGNASRVIYVNFDVTAFINDLTMANGNGVGEGNGEFFDFGGGIFNVGALTLNRCTVSDNTADSGGGILNSHILTLRECTISGNTATSLDTGGGIRSFNGTLYVINSTISGNQANYDGGFNGGGIWTFGPATIINSTITNNQAAGDESAGGVHRDSGDFIIKNSIIAGNTGTDGATADVVESPLYDGAFVTQGYNLIGKNDGMAAVFPAGNPNANRDIVGTSATPINPLLGSLQNNGGPTNTHLLLTGSPAIDKGAAATDPDNGVAITTDQRGSHRPADNPAIANATMGNGSDIGAHEIGCQTITATMGGGGTICASGAANVTVTVSGGVAPYTVQLSNGAMQTGNGPVFTFLVSPDMTTTYTVASGNADGSGCPITGSGSATVTVRPPTLTPSITPGGPTTICAGGSVTLTSSSASGNQWFRNGNLIGGATNQTYSATAAGNYTVVVTANGCASAPSTALTVTVNPPPTTANAGLDRRILPGGAVSLAANTPATGMGAWSVVSGPSLLSSQFSSTTAPAATFTPAGGEGAYLLRWTISNAPCAPSSDDVLITVDSNPLITVTSTADGSLASLAGNGTCELREAIAAANTDVPVGECAEGITGTDTITFAPNVTGTITLTAGALSVRKSVTIQGPGARVLTVSGGNATRILSAFADGPVTINDLTMANGNGSDPSGNGAGGAIYNRGTLTLNRSVVADSTANQYGGGIFNEDGALTVRECTIYGNTANGQDTGGGITNWGTLLVINSTISGNQANNSVGGNGGGIHSISNDTIIIINSTITNNQAAGPDSAGGIRREAANLTLKNTIVAGNTGTGGATADLNEAGNLIGGFTTQGYNLIGQRDGARSFPAGNPNANQDIVGTSGAPINPLLGSLADNGGPTDTHLLLPNSPAIDKGAAATDPVTSAALTTDQRGFQRPLDTALANAASGNGSDIGAVEGVFIPPTITPNGIILRQDSLAGALQIATASDADDTANTLQIQISGNGGATYGNSATLNGVTVTLTDSNMGGVAGPNPDALGQVFADVTATCAATNATFKLRVTDGGGLTDAQDFTVTVTPNTAPTLGTYAATTLDYNAGATVTPNAPPADSGAVALTVSAPGWLGTLSINQTSGAVTFGNAQPPGMYTVTVTATDSCQAVTQQSFTLVVNCPVITVTNPATATGTAGVAFSQTFTQTGGVGTTIFSTTSTLPNGLTLLSGGTLSGTPTQPGTFPIVVKATDSNGCAGTSATYNLVINCSTLNLAPASIANGEVGMAYSQQFSVTGSFGNSTAFTVSMGVLPAGLSLSSAGLLSGTPTAPFNGSFRIRAQDSLGCFGEQMYSLSIACNTLTISPNTLSPVQANVVFSQQLSASGVAPHTFTLSAVPTPPNWLAITAGGLLMGTPPATGTFDFAVSVVDVNGCPGSQSYSLTVNCPSVTIAALPPAIAGSAYNGNLSAIPAGTYQFGSANKPAWLTIAGNGAMTGTPTSAGTFNFDVTVTGPGACAKTVAVALTVNCPAIAVTPASLPNASVGVPYNQTLGATPSGTAYTFAVTAGLLPPGLTLNGNGSFSGAPAQSGTFNFRVTATGFGTCSQFQDYVLSVGCPGISLAPASLPGGTVGAAYNQTINVPTAGGYSYSVTSGALPTGLTLNAATGAITGAPATSGSFTFTVTASQGGCSGSHSYTVVIACAGVTITTTSLPAGAAGNAYAQTIAVSPTGSYSFSLAQGNLPSGLTLNPTTGLLSGLPSAAGTASFIIKAQAANGCSGTQAFTLQINCPVATLNPASLPNGSTTAAYNQTLSATPAGGNYSFSVAGQLPPGLNLNSATGSLTGTPTANGTFNFTITATGFGGCVGSKAYSITVGGGGCPTITLAELPGGQPGQLYNNSVTATPSGTYSYAMTSGSLPPGLTFYASLGLINGYPTTAGSYSFTISATDANHCTGSKQYNLLIGGAAVHSLVFGDFDGDGKADLSVWRGQSGDWMTVNSGNGKLKTEAWGSTAAPYYDVMTPGDYDGDGKMDLAVFRRSTGQWLIKGSRDGAVTAKVWGVGTDIPVPGDYDGDSKTDLAVWRGAESNWYILLSGQSSDGQTETISWGTSRAPYRDVAVPADYDGDGKTDLAVFRQANGHWYIRLSSSNEIVDQAWGVGSDVPVAADYDGDGKADLAVWRGADTNWYVLRSSDGQTQSISWGTSSLGDVPAPTDYDGDRKADPAVWRASSGMWLVKNSRDGAVKTIGNGQPGDAPVIARP